MAPEGDIAYMRPEEHALLFYGGTYSRNCRGPHNHATACIYLPYSLGQRLGKAQGQLFQAGYLFVVVVCLWVKTGKRNFRNATLYIYS